MSKLKEDLISNISHDVRTPLTAIKGYVQIILSQKSNPNFDLSNFFERIEENVKRLDVLFSSILNLNQIENDTLISFESVDVSNIIERCVDNLNIKYEVKSINVHFDSSRDCTIYSNNNLVENILSNVLENSFKYNNLKGSIYIDHVIKNNNVHISIRDTGIGIAKEYIPHIFERFYCVDKSRSEEFGATGLGLAIVFQLVELMNGEIRVESTEGSGTSFHVVLPLQKIAEQAKAHSSDKRWVVFATNSMLEQFLLNKLITFNQDAKVLKIDFNN